MPVGRAPAESSPPPCFLFCGFRRNKARRPGSLPSFPIVPPSASDKCYSLIVENLEISDKPKEGNGITPGLEHCGDVADAFPS